MKNILTFTFLFCSICISFCQIDPNTINTFHPDPITSLNQASYLSMDDFKPDSFFEPAYVERVISYNSISSTSILGSNVNIVEIEGPTITQLNKPGDLKVQRSDPRFKAYNAYYHADKFIGWIKSLSTSSTANLPIINIDPYTIVGSNGSQIISDNEIKYITHFNEGSAPDPIAVESVDMAEDAFGIAFGMTDMFLLHAKKEILLGDLLTDFGGFNMEDVELGLMDYLAQSYVHSLGTTDHKCYKWGGQPSVEIGNGIEIVQQRYTDFNVVGREFKPNDFPDNKTSQWLSSTLMSINENTSREKCDKWIMNSLSAEYANTFTLDAQYVNTIDDMYQYIWYLFDVALDLEDGNGVKVFSNDDLCAIYTEFSLTYGENFWKYSVELPALVGDIHISDYPNDQGAAPHTQPAYNSPHIWNRNSNDNLVGNQKAIKNTPNYLYVRLNGDLCDLTSSHSSGSDMQLKVYYNSAIGTTWAPGTSKHDWEHDDATDDHHRYGDLIGTIDLNTLVCTYDDVDANGGPIVEDIAYQKNGDHTILEIPWTPPVELPDLPHKTLFSYDFSYLARMGFSAYDPISITESEDVHTNAQQSNNIAYKRNIIYVADDPNHTGGGNGPATPGIILTGDPDPQDPIIRIRLIPSTYDPDPITLGPGDPVRPLFNDYTQYGEVAIVLDPDLFAAWSASGQQGSGFTINADNEIIADDRDFYLEGIRLPGRDIYSVIGVKFIPYDQTFDKRTGFDVILEQAISGKLHDAVHVEVRPPNSQASTRRAIDDYQEARVKVYPNPVSANTIQLNSEMPITTVSVYDIRGERQNVELREAEMSLDITTLHQGVYIIHMKMADGGIITKKIIRM